MKRIRVNIIMEDTIHDKLKKMSQETFIPISRLVEIALKEKFEELRK